MRRFDECVTSDIYNGHSNKKNVDEFGSKNSLVHSVHDLRSISSIITHEKGHFANANDGPCLDTTDYNITEDDTSQVMHFGREFKRTSTPPPKEAGQIKMTKTLTPTKTHLSNSIREKISSRAQTESSGLADPKLMIEDEIQMIEDKIIANQKRLEDSIGKSTQEVLAKEYLRQDLAQMKAEQLELSKILNSGYNLPAKDKTGILPGSGKSQTGFK
jgi:hypothetical protein